MVTITFNPDTKELTFCNIKKNVSVRDCGEEAERKYLDWLIYLADKVDYTSLIEISQAIGDWLSVPENFDKEEYWTKMYLAQQYCLNKLTEIEERNNIKIKI